MLRELQKGERCRWRKATVVVTDQHSGSHEWLEAIELNEQRPAPKDLHCLVRIESGVAAGRIEPVLVSELVEI